MNIQFSLQIFLEAFSSISSTIIQMLLRLYEEIQEAQGIGSITVLSLDCLFNC